MKSNQTLIAKRLDASAATLKERPKNNREFFIDLKKSLIMEDGEDSESLRRSSTPKNRKDESKDIHKLYPANKYEEIIYNRGSLSIVLPDRMLLPNGVEDVLLFPTAGKHASPVFFGHGGNNKLNGKAKNFMWSNDSDPDVIIDQDFDS